MDAEIPEYTLPVIPAIKSNSGVNTKGPTGIVPKVIVGINFFSYNGISKLIFEVTVKPVWTLMVEV